MDMRALRDSLHAQPDVAAPEETLSDWDGKECHPISAKGLYWFAVEVDTDAEELIDKGHLNLPFTNARERKLVWCIAAQVLRFRGDVSSVSIYPRVGSASEVTLSLSGRLTWGGGLIGGSGIVVPMKLSEEDFEKVKLGYHEGFTGFSVGGVGRTADETSKKKRTTVTRRKARPR